MECPEIVKIKLLRNYSTYTVGRVVDCDDETARRLIQEGTAEPDGLVETATIEPEVERADARPRRGRRRNAVPQPDRDERTDCGAGDAE